MQTYPFGMRRVTDSWYAPLGFVIDVSVAASIGDNSLICSSIGQANTVTIIGAVIVNGNTAIRITTAIVNGSGTSYNLGLSTPLLAPIPIGFMVATDRDATLDGTSYAAGTLRRITVSRYEPDVPPAYTTTIPTSGGSSSSSGTTTLTNLALPSGFANNAVLFNYNNTITGSAGFTYRSTDTVPTLVVNGPTNNTTASSGFSVMNARALLLGGNNVWYNNGSTNTVMSTSSGPSAALSFNDHEDPSFNQLTIRGANSQSMGFSQSVMDANSLAIGNGNVIITTGSNPSATVLTNSNGSLNGLTFNNIHDAHPNMLTINGPNPLNTDYAYTLIGPNTMTIGNRNLPGTDATFEFDGTNIKLKGADTDSSGRTITTIMNQCSFSIGNNHLGVTNPMFKIDANGGVTMYNINSGVSTSLTLSPSSLNGAAYTLNLPNQNTAGGYLFNDGQGNTSWSFPTTVSTTSTGGFTIARPDPASFTFSLNSLPDGANLTMNLPDLANNGFWFVNNNSGIWNSQIKSITEIRTNIYFSKPNMWTPYIYTPSFGVPNYSTKGFMIFSITIPNGPANNLIAFPNQCQAYFVKMNGILSFMVSVGGQTFQCIYSFDKGFVVTSTYKTTKPINAQTPISFGDFTLIDDNGLYQFTDLDITEYIVSPNLSLKAQNTTASINMIFTPPTITPTFGSTNQYSISCNFIQCSYVVTTSYDGTVSDATSNPSTQTNFLVPGIPAINTVAGQMTQMN